MQGLRGMKSFWDDEAFRVFKDFWGFRVYGYRSFWAQGFRGFRAFRVSGQGLLVFQRSFDANLNAWLMTPKPKRQSMS